MTARGSSPAGPTARFRPLDALLLLVLVVCTWQKLSWDVLGRLAVTDVLEAAFVVGVVGSRAVRGDRRVAPAAAVVAAFGLAFLALFLAGLGNVASDAGVDQWTKAVTKWLLHFSFLVCAVAHLARGGARLHGAALQAFVLGLTLNAAYAVAQLGAQAVFGLNLDRALLAPVFTGAATSGANVYGRVSGVTVEGAPTLTTVYRGTGLVDDPNHLGVMLCVPICLLLARALGLGGDAEARRRWALTGLAGALALVLLLTQSRSGLLGLGAGLLTLAVPFRRELVSRATLVPAAVVVALVGAFVVQRQAYVLQVLESRLQTGARGTNTHLYVYSLIPDVLDRFPLLGLGLNNFSLLYEFETGRAEFGPHSYPVQVLTETGLLGAVLTAVFITWVAGRAYALLPPRTDADRDARESRALGWGLLAALAATLAGNLFYLTMTFPYWYAVVLLVVGAPAALARRAAPVRSARRSGQLLGAD